MIVQDILLAKGTDVHMVGPEASLDDVVQELVPFDVGSLVVCESTSKGMDNRIIGIITERDILRAQAAHNVPLGKLQVGRVMTSELIISSPKDRVERAMRLMTEHRIRHLPVVDRERLCGIISIGDIVKAHHDQLEMDNHYMRSYIRGEGAEVATPLE